MDRDRELAALRTQVANQAASLAQTVSEGFEGFHLGAGDYVVELMIPEGPSTGGGTQARQTLRLVPRRKGYATVVVGAVDPVTKVGEIRTFEHVAVRHEIRFKRPIEITPDEYDEFLRKMDIVFNLARIRATRSPAPPELLDRRKAGSKISAPVLVLFVVVMALVAFVVYRIAHTVRP